MKPNYKEDYKLAQSCLKGKANAQRALYDAYKVGMYGMCLRYMKHVEEAEDVLQEGFIKAFEQLGQYKGDGPLGGWSPCGHPPWGIWQVFPSLPNEADICARTCVPGAWYH